MKFVIIGGDAAGMSAASRAKRRSPGMEVIVIEKTDDVSYSACGLPYNIADPEREIDDLIVRRPDEFRAKQKIDLYNGYEALEIDRNRKQVKGITSKGSEFSFSFDRLLIATGASAVKPDIEGIDSPGVFMLRNLEHGRAIKRHLAQNKVKKAVIIGMGYIALEMCEALYTHGIEVSMIKPGKTFLPWMDPELAGVVLAEVKKHDIRLYPGFKPERITDSGGILEVQAKDLILSGEIVIAATGVRPNSGLAKKAGLELGPNDAISVNKRLETSDPAIYAAGDCGDAYHVVTGKKVWIPLALRANRAGWAVADNVCGNFVELEGVCGTAVFKVFDLQVARTGLTAREASEAGFTPASVTVQTRSKAHAHPGSTPIYVHMVGDTKTGRLLGVQMVGKEGVAHRINAPACALHAGMTVKQYSQLDLAYAPPFSPVWDPTLVAANQLLKKL